MNKYLPLVPALGIVTTIAYTAPTLALERVEIAAATEEVTVRIEGEETSGTGTIIERDGNTYTVLTCWHVVNAEGGLEVATVDGKTYTVSSVKNSNEIDLAVVQFVSSTPYEIAELGRSEDVLAGTSGYIAGYPDPLPDVPELAFDFQDTSVTRRQQTGKDGYRLVHDTPTTRGSSGGGIFDDDAYLVGINGRTTEDAEGRSASGLAIPLELFLTEETSLTTPSSFSPPTDPVSLGQRKLDKKNYQSAVDDFDRALAANPNDFDALSGRGKAYLSLGEYNAAIEDFGFMLRQNDNNATVFFYQGYAYSQLEDYPEAIANYNEAIALNPNYAHAYNNRGNSYKKLEDYPEAIANFNEAIALDLDHVIAYYNRGNSYYALKEYESAIADFDEAIRLNPEWADAYIFRGNAHRHLGDKTQTLENYHQAANLYQEQGNAVLYKKTFDLIEQLQ